MNHIKSYLVGGAVRDTLLGLTPKDKDYVVVGSNASELMAAGFEQVGMGFPVYLHPHTNEEYALARREKKVGAGYTGFEFETGLDVTLAEDLSRRDLTINSMAFDDEGHLVDPFGGRHDLKFKVLRHTSEAFGEDPLRVVRLARFFARYSDFTVDGSTMTLCSQMVDRGDLDELPDERFWVEIEKAFRDGSTKRFWELLFEIGALQKVRFFQKLFGTRWSAGRFEHVLAVAKAFQDLGFFADEEVAHFFSAATAPDNVENLFASTDAGRVYSALQRVRQLSRFYTAVEIHELIMSIRGYSEENQTFDQLARVMQAVMVAGENLPISTGDLNQAVVMGRKITAQTFIDDGLQGKAIGEAMAFARVNMIALALNLKMM